MNIDPRVHDLVRRWQQMRQQGQTPVLDELCADYPELRDTVGREIEALALKDSFQATTDIQTPSPGGLPPPPSDVTVPEQAGRFQLRFEIARGGMGAVLRAHDPAIGRDVALKVILPQHRDDPMVVRRFLDEVRLAGQLQHPGVAPIYDVGTLPDGRPFFAMKLIEGRTLAQLLREQQDLPRFLRYFESICQTIGYAHARRIVHRDIKPLNIMVGAFGEVQVMDWGLAKKLAASRQSPLASAGDGKPDTPASSALGEGQGEEDAKTFPSPALRRGFGGDGSESQAGSIVGTPSYMAPEQARGEAVDARSDVFALGAILCELLTGAPPLAGKRTLDLVTLAAKGDLSDAFARLDGCGADAELVRLAKACLASNPQARPADGAAVAAAVSAYMGGVQERLRQAEIAQARAEEERKRRRVQRALAAALLVLVLAGSAGAWLFQQQRQARAAEVERQRQAADAAVGQAMAETRLLLEQARTAPLREAGRFREAVAAAQKAEELARTALASDEVRGQSAELVVKVSQEEATARRDARLLAALLEVRAPREGSNNRSDARGLITAMAQPSADEQFASAFRAWGVDVDAVRVEEAAARLAGRPAAVVTEIVAALDEWASERRQRSSVAASRRLVALAEALDGPDSRRRELRGLLRRNKLLRERALGALSMALRPVPVPFDAGLGRDRGRLLRLAAQIDPAAEPVLGVLTLARTLFASGEGIAGERLLRGALRARPQEAVLYQALGQLLAGQVPPRWMEAVEAFAAARALRPDLGDSLANALTRAGRAEEGLALYQRLADDRPGNPWIHFRRGEALQAMGRLEEAELALGQAVRLDPNFLEAHNNLGGILVLRRRFKEAEEPLRTAIRLGPTSTKPLGNLAVALFRQGRYQEAEAACRQAIGLDADSSQGHHNLGAVFLAQGQARHAEREFRRACQLEPDSPRAHYNLGLALNQQGKSEQAETAFRSAIRLDPSYTEALYNLGIALYSQRRYKEAEAVCREAIRLAPDSFQAHNNLGIALKALGRYKEAEAACRESIRLQPDASQPHYNLGNALYAQKRLDEAEKAYRKAIRLAPNDAEAHHSLANVLADRGRVAEAETEFRRALRLNPAYPKAHYNLGILLGEGGRHREAEEAFHEALRLQPDFPEAQTNLGNALGSQGRLKEAEAAFRQALRLRPDALDAHAGLGIVLENQGRFVDAVRAFRRGLAFARTSPAWRPRFTEWLRGTERLADLDGRLPAILAGTAEPASAAERLELASLCRHRARRLHAAAARLAAEAFTMEPKLADDLANQPRYHAACSAVLAAAGQANDARILPDKVTAVLQRQALRWLRADLALHAKAVQRGNPKTLQAVQKRLTQWQRDSDLATVRDREALSKLDEDESAAWRKLWDEVEALRRRAGRKEPQKPDVQARGRLRTSLASASGLWGSSPRG
jgi:Flp pilus assembly protein TadD